MISRPYFPGDDARLPEVRRDVFLALVRFHDRFKNRPGCVYFALPSIVERLGIKDLEWVAFLNGFSQNPVVTYRLLQVAPSREDYSRATAFFRDNYDKLAIDTDRFRFKHRFDESVSSFLMAPPIPMETFESTWDWATSELRYFGRLTAWSYLEYRQILGLPQAHPDTLMLRDISGSKSHRNGLCKLLGRDDLDDHSSNPLSPVRYADDTLSWLEAEELLLVAETGSSRFTLESDLCMFKSMFRPNRRYPNVYADMLHGRIRYSEAKFGDTLGELWDMRREFLPRELRQEDGPLSHYVNLDPIAQNLFRLTGNLPFLGISDSRFLL